jgi:SAM-dependent methyltransferase
MADYGDASVAAAYARNRTAMSAVLAALVEGVRITGQSQILEVGCGTGNYIRAISEIAGCRCYGLDRSEAMLEHARASAGHVEYLRGDAAQLAFSDETFDLVFSVDAIHHIAEGERYFAEAHRVLRQQGWVCTMTCSEDLLRDYVVLGRYFPDTIPINIARYPSVSSLRESMARAGFRDVSEAVVSDSVVVTDSSRYADKAYSALHRISEDAFKRGLARLERDLAMGPIRGVRRSLALWGKK